MNSLDIGLLAILAISVGSGVVRGLINEVFSLVGVLLAILAAFLFSPTLSPKLQEWVNLESAAYAVAFMILFVGTMLATALLGRLLNKAVSLARLGLVNRLLGGGFGLVRGALIGIMVVLGMTLFLDTNAPLIAESRITPRLAWSARIMAPLLPEKPREVLLERLDGIPERDPREDTI